jgi:hypothetical protein
MYLVMAMTVVAVLATGVHVMSYTAPALAEQDRQSRAAQAAAEHSIVPHTPAAAGDGLPVPILVGGVVLAFAVGLSGGHLHRRRRLARREQLLAATASVEERPRAVAPPPAPAPEPPAVAAPAPQPVELAPPAPEPAPEPPAPRAPAPRVVKPPAAPVPPPPAPPRRQKPAAAPPRRKAPLRVSSDPPTPAAEVPLAKAPEVPRAQPAAEPPPTPPLAEAPEALHAREAVPPSAEAPGPQAPPAGPGRRFARVAPWPEEADDMWTCELDWKAGYRKSYFRAMATGPGDDKRHALAESAPVRWALMGEPEPPTPELALRVRGLVEALESAGWQHIGRGRHWYEQRFLWRGSGEPQPVAVADVESAEG